MFIFYFLLNEEVRKKLKESKKLKRLDEKKKNTQMSNINDLIMETMLKIKTDENFDEEDDEEDEEEEEQIENTTNDSLTKFYKSTKREKNESPISDSKV